MNHTTSKLRITRKITITILMTLSSTGSQQFLLAPPEAQATAKAAEPQFKVTTPEETMQKQQSVAQKALIDAQINVPKQGAPTVSDGTRNTTKTDNSTGITMSTKTIYNADGTTTHAAYQSDGSFQMETTHLDGKSSIKTTGNINTGEVKVKTVDATDQNTGTTFVGDNGSYKARAKVAETTFNSDGTFNMNIKNNKGDVAHTATGDGKTTTKTSYDTQNDTQTTTISNAWGDTLSKEFFDKNQNITTTTTFNPKTGDRLTSIESSPDEKITTTYDPRTQKPRTKITLDKESFTTTTIEYNSDGSSNLTAREADGTVTKITTDVNGKETTTSVVKSTSRIVNERQSQANSVQGDPVKAQKLVKDIAHDKGITLTDTQIEAKSQEFLSATKSPGFFANFIESISRLFADSSQPTKAQIKSKTALTSSATAIDLFAKPTPTAVAA